MSKEFTKDEIIVNKKEAIKELNKLLEYYINDPTGKHLKKANLLSFWIKDYVRMINFEEKFDPKKNIAYKRGNIVKVNFGFNIGSEYGGLHYGIVLDNHNDHGSPVVTVVPLTSIKDGKPVHDNSVVLGNEIYRSLKLKYDTINKALKEEQDEIATALAAFAMLVDLSSKSIDELKQCVDDKSAFEEKAIITESYLDSARKLQLSWKEKEKHNTEEQAYLDKIGKEIAQMKEGSIALVNQITTVSKMRIFDPRNLKGVLSGISLSAESMDKINEKIKELYVFQ